MTTVAFSPNGQWLLSGGEDGLLRLFHLVKEKEQKSWKTHEEGITAIAWHPQNNWMASGSYDKMVKIWNEDGALVQTLKGHGEAIAALTF